MPPLRPVSSRRSRLAFPGDAVMALIIGALILNGIIPGPRLMVDQPELFWGVIASFFVGNIILLLINIPLIRLWVLLLRIPYQKLYPMIVVMICVGVYSHRTSVTDVLLTLAFGILGYLMKNYRFEPAPVLLGLRARPAAGRQFPPHDAALWRRLHDFPNPPDQRGLGRVFGLADRFRDLVEHL